MKQFILSTLIFTILLISSASSQPPTLVVTDQVVELDFQDQITLIGRTKAIITSKIVAEVAGRVQSIDAGEGNSISSGSPLLSINPQRTELSYKSKEAQMKIARAEAELAKNALVIAKELFSKSLIFQSRLDSVTARSTIAKENYQQLLAEANRLKLDLDNCRIRAPFDGHTIRQLVEVGEWVKIGQPVFDMVDLSRVKVIVDLPEKHFGHLNKNSSVTILVSGENKEPISGKVTGIAPDASGVTHTFPVIITIDNRDGKLGGGMLVRATLNLKKSFKSLAVSKDAIVSLGPQTVIYTVADGKAAPIPVTLSSTNGTMVAITGPGLSVGMPVVVRGNERIYPGSPVTVEGEAPPEQGAQPEQDAQSEQSDGDNSQSEESTE